MAQAPSWLTSQESTFWTVLSRVGVTCGIITSIVTIVALVLTGKKDAPATILAIYICIFSTLLLFLLLRQENRYRREVKYAPATGPMRRAFACVAEASWNLFNGDSSKEAFRLRLRESLQHFSAAFSLITDDTCRASIKLIRLPEAAQIALHDIQVFTLCRDDDENGIHEGQVKPDRIVDNTDFKQIFQDAAAHFFCNDLPSQITKGYRNSHWDERLIEAGEFDYRATIVWPIQRDPSFRVDKQEPQEVIGFLCVDTLTVGAFHRVYDVSIGAAFSQALHLALHRLIDLERASSSSDSKNARNIGGRK